TVVQRYDPAALDALRYREQIFGLPVAMDTLVLYYDTTLVAQPPTSLDGLLAEAAKGRLVAMTTNFVDAFWGVSAFGGSLFDDEGRVILDRGGFANWLAWLKEARDAPGMLLDSDRGVLRNRFVEDGVAYYIGYASEYTLIVEGTEENPGKGEDQVGVAVLPAGPTSGAAPFLNVQGFLFSSVSSDNQRAIALEFAKFITNAEQQSTLMRETRLVPANNRVRVNPRLDPVVASFTAQARAAVPMLNLPEMDAVLQYGGDAYTRVLEGVLDPAEASVSVTSAINQANGFDAVAAIDQQCTAIGTIYLGYVADPRQEAALSTVLQQLEQECPLVIVNAVPIDIGLASSVGNVDAQVALTNPLDIGMMDGRSVDALAARLATVLPSEGRLDLLLLPHRWIPALAERQQLRDLSTVLAAETLQRFRPAAVDAMRYQGKLYGLPYTINLDALYYNRTLVSEPAHTLDELLQQVGSGTPVVLDSTFRHSFWGIATFGGRLLDEQGLIALGNGPLVDWLQWLASARNNANLTVTADRAAFLAQFLDATSAYYVGGPEMLLPLQQQLGIETVGVARL
ncbi:MAG: extracellular solute-binding protein, partial [Caldilineaceae bacterium]|nr:extracellular solute-binding protein [Caldilineaceae bacterium]